VRRLAPVPLVFALLLGACSSGAASEQGSFLAAKVSGPLPPLSGTTLGGGSLVPAAYRGHVVVVNFWNPECPPCRKEAPELKTAWQRLSPLGVRFIGVMVAGMHWPDDQSGARAYVREFGLRYPVVVDKGAAIALAARVPGIPETIVADASGQMRYRVLGALKPGELTALITGLSMSS